MEINVCGGNPIFLVFFLAVSNHIPEILVYGLNIFYFKRNWIANKHKAYKWLSIYNYMCSDWQSTVFPLRTGHCYFVAIFLSQF